MTAAELVAGDRESASSSRRATLWHRLRNRVHASHRFLVLRTNLSGPPAADHVDIRFRVATPADLANLQEFECSRIVFDERLGVSEEIAPGFWPGRR